MGDAVPEAERVVDVRRTEGAEIGDVIFIEIAHFEKQ